ncbi:Uu.00g099380.m01.CDS01 [Anthostomella pinea]|uniref:Uu.00g099380.m01.CDS01 n=1 Tax=Anthostomella pinea TaxID=933095 RepID=A0AAI8YCT8_9PEZI|nr:Uu.00g099380.m01.CDS01 [Anthostomella pinea]
MAPLLEKVQEKVLWCHGLDTFVFQELVCRMIEASVRYNARPQPPFDRDQHSALAKEIQALRHMHDDYPDDDTILRNRDIGDDKSWMLGDWKILELTEPLHHDDANDKGDDKAKGVFNLNDEYEYDHEEMMMDIRDAQIESEAEAEAETRGADNADVEMEAAGAEPTPAPVATFFDNLPFRNR